MFEDLLSNPGAGVGDQQTKSGSGYSRPIKDLLKERLLDVQATKDGSAQEVEEYLNNLLKSDIQIYWPYSELWDGKTTPIVTYDPGDGATSNYGYEFIYSSDGVSVTDSILVDEGVAQTRPVWVINRNDDSVYTPLKSLTESPEYKSYVAQAEDSEVRRLTLTTLTMMQHYDSWFGGASEFFVKCAAVDDFHAETEEEMREYSPKITDFMIVVQRNQLKKTIPLRALILTNYTEQMENMALVITEDDGGTRTSWDCTALVRVESKSYGVELKLPFSSRDDIVWRGQLASTWFERNNKQSAHFGDVDLTFELMQ